MPIPVQQTTTSVFLLTLTCQICEHPGVWCRLGIHEAAKLVIGIPMLTSSRSMQFWLDLCGAAQCEGAQHLVNGFQRAEELGPDALKAHCLQFTSAMIQKVCLI